MVDSGRITADTALRLSKFFGTTAKFWLGLQIDYDLEESTTAIAGDLEKIHPVAEVVRDQDMTGLSSGWSKSYRFNQPLALALLTST